MTYNKKRMLSYGVILISVLLAYFCRLVRPKNTFARNFADQCRNCIYLGLYCAWVIYLEKHVVYKKNAQMSDCNWLSDGILVLCKNSEISYFS